MKLSLSSFFYPLILVAFSILIWLPSRHYPLFWDSTYVVKTATQIYDSNFTKLVSQEQGYAHPTLFPTILALLWKIFGTDSVVGHYLTLPFLPILLVSTYFLIKNATTKEYGLLAGLLVGFTPVVLAEYVNVYTDLPMAALVALATYFWSQKKYLPWGILFSAAILTKIPAVAIIPYFVLDAYFSKKSKGLKYSLILPVSVLAVWFIYHRLVSGWWFIYTQSGLQLSIARNAFGTLSDALQIVLTIAISQGRWLPSLIGLIAFFLIPQQTIVQKLKLIKKEVVVIFAAALVFAATGEFGFRYAIFIYPFYYLILFKLLHQLTKNSQTYYTISITSLALCLLLFVNFWHPKQQPYTTNVFNPPDDLGIIDYLQVFRWLASYAVVNNHQNVAYYGGFPDSISLLEPKMGLVDTPQNFYDCKDYQPNPDLTQIIIMHPFSPTVYPCYQIIQSNNLPVLTGKEVNGKWIDLYLASPSAQAKPLPQTQ